MNNVKGYPVIASVQLIEESTFVSPKTGKLYKFVSVFIPGSDKIFRVYIPNDKSVDDIKSFSLRVYNGFLSFVPIFSDVNKTIGKGGKR